MARLVRRKVDHGKIFCRIRCRSVVGETVRQGDLHLHVSYIVRRRRDELVVGLVPGQCCSDRSPGRDVANRHETEIVEALNDLRPYEDLPLGIRRCARESKRGTYIIARATAAGVKKCGIDLYLPSELKI
jgi:hypothetical protein